MAEAEVKGNAPGPFWVLPIDKQQTKFAFAVDFPDEDWTLVYRTPFRDPQRAFEVCIPKARELRHRWMAYPDVDALARLLEEDADLGFDWQLIRPKWIEMRAMRIMEKGGLTWHSAGDLAA